MIYHTIWISIHSINTFENCLKQAIYIDTLQSLFIAWIWMKSWSKYLRMLVTTVHFTDRNLISETVYCRIPNEHLYVYNILFLQKEIEPHVFVLSVLQLIRRDLAILFKSFSSKKKYVLNLTSHGILHYFWSEIKKRFSIQKRSFPVVLQNRCS